MLQSLAGFAFPLGTEQIRSAMPRPSSRIAVRSETEFLRRNRSIRKGFRARIELYWRMLYCALSTLRKVNYC